jgi:hypothetical protein
LTGRSRDDRDLWQTWTKRVSHARRVRQDWERRYLVETCERFFLGNQHEWGDLHPWFDVHDASCTFNYIWATIMSQLPGLYYQNPTFNVTPNQPVLTPQAEAAAAMEEALLDRIAQQDRHLKQAGQFAVLQTFFRIGVLKIIYDPRMEPNPQAGEIIWAKDPDGKPILDPQTQRGIPLLDPQTQEPQTEPERIMTDEVYRWQWVDAACMLLPDQGPDPSRWTWIGEEVYVPLEVAQDDTRFPKRLRDQLQANSKQGARRPYDTGSGYHNTDGLLEGEEPHVCLYEAWDIWHKKYYVWADGQPYGDAFLVQDDVPPGVEDHPYALALGYTPILGPKPSPWPVPHVFQWLSLQREYNTRRKQITQGCSRSGRKTLYEESTFSDEDEALKALVSSDDHEAVKITNLERPPIPMKEEPLPIDLYNDVQLLHADWRAIAGVTASQLQTVEAGQSPTEAQFAQQFATQRDLIMRDVVTELLTQAGAKMSQRVKATMTLDMLVKIRQLSDAELGNVLVKIYGPDIQMLTQQLPNLKQMMTQRFGQEQWQRVTRESLIQESQVSIVPGSMRARTTEVERQQLLSFLSVLGQSPQIALSRELLRVVARAFEIESEPLLDELNALAQQMVQVNAHQAGRDQGGSNPQSRSASNTPAQNGGAPPQVASRLAAAMTGR